ncbi:unnamed protein product, partial [marine sediment metagenome]
MLKVAVIGVGSMGKNHARVYQESPNASLVALSDTNLPLAKSVADRYGGEAFQDYRQMLEAVRPDAVSIAVPTADHEQVALDALESGAHLIIEKPIAATMEQGRKIIEKAN